MTDNSNQRPPDFGRPPGSEPELQDTIPELEQVDDSNPPLETSVDDPHASQEPTQEFSPEETDPKDSPTRTRISPKDWWKTRWTQLRGSQNFEPRAFGEKLGKFMHHKGAAGLGKLITILVCAFFFADPAALLISRWIPDPPPVRLPRGGAQQKRARSINDYSMIFTRNLFNSRGIIPGEETGVPSTDQGGAPVPTALPFNLIGTLILRNELRSIATIEDKSASQVYPVRIDDEIPSKAKIIKIEPRRVIFVNIASGRREFIELPEEAGTAPRIALGTSRGPSLGVAGIEQTAPNQFSISRQEVDKALSNMNNILTQARCVPHFDNGIPAGYKCYQIVPGSIYDKLGIKNGDVITGFDGQAISDPSKAFEALAGIKDRSHLDLQIKRDGKPLTFSYDFR